MQISNTTKGNHMVNQDPFFYVQGAEFEIFPTLEEANRYARSLDLAIEAEFEKWLRGDKTRFKDSWAIALIQNNGYGQTTTSYYIKDDKLSLVFAVKAGEAKFEDWKLAKGVDRIKWG
jgi:hypothetical protein